MPYISKAAREHLHKPIVELKLKISTCGELNYTITKLLALYLESEVVSYTSLNEVIGVLECAKMEMYRRIAAPYEDKKKKENGDVY